MNFGQDSLRDEEAMKNAVQYTDADHAIVRLPSPARPGKPHTLRLVRVDGAWKFSDAAMPGLDEGSPKMETLFRKLAAATRQTEQEISAGQYQSFEEAVRVLTKRVTSKPSTPN